MDLPETIQNAINSALTAAAGAVGAWLTLRRRYSSDSSGIAKDKAETTLMGTLIAERNLAMSNAREAWAQRIEDAQRIAKLEGMLEANDRETARLRDELFALRLHLRKLTAIIVRLDPQASALLELDTQHGDGIPIQFHRRSGDAANIDKETMP